MADFEETFRRELAEDLAAVFQRIENDWLCDYVFGDGTGEPLGILNTAGVTIETEELR